MPPKASYVLDPRNRILENINIVDECWIWLRSIRAGYGGMTVAGVKWRAHRYSYTVFKGEIPEGKLIKHSCDVKLCVNPQHLSTGTNSDNVQEALARNLIPVGEEHHNNKYSEGQVGKVRTMRSMGHTYKEIAANTGVNYHTVWDIVNGRARKG